MISFYYDKKQDAYIITLDGKFLSVYYRLADVDELLFIYGEKPQG